MVAYCADQGSVATRVLPQAKPYIFGYVSATSTPWSPRTTSGGDPQDPAQEACRCERGVGADARAGAVTRRHHARVGDAEDLDVYE